MTGSYSIRLARREEVARLGEIEAAAAELFVDTPVHTDLRGAVFDAEDLAALIDLGQVWVACYQDEVPVGFIIVVKVDDTLHIEELDVLPGFGRRGIGLALLEHACRWGIEAGFNAATLSTFRDVPWNAPFYLKHGFQILEPEELTEWMVRLQEIEGSKGLRPETRVMMRRELC